MRCRMPLSIHFSKLMVSCQWLHLSILTQLHLPWDFDPNSDTPIEILHVILLGIVKYFWRDAVSRLSSTRGELIARLLSVDTTGLGFHKLRGKVLVQYAGSLIGRDFRAIIQVAPIVLHGLLPTNIYEAWLALNRVTPLAFQHEINDIDQFCVSGQRCVSSTIWILIQSKDCPSYRHSWASESNCTLVAWLVQQAEISPPHTPAFTHPSLWTSSILCNWRVWVSECGDPSPKRPLKPISTKQRHCKWL